MAKKDKSKKNSPQSATTGGYLYTQQAEQAFIKFLTRMPDIDEVLRKAGVSRNRLSVLMYDDEIYQCVEKRQDKLESSPFRLEPNDTAASKILADEISKWWSELTLGTQNARWYGYSVIEAVYNQNAVHFEGQTITPYIGWHWVGVKPMQWFEPKSDGRLILGQNYNDQRRDIECDQKFKHFLTQCKPTFENPFGEALFSRLYWLHFFKNGTYKMWAKYVERFGNPLLVGKSTRGVEAMLKALLNAHAQSVLSINSDESVEAISSNQNGTTAFESFDKKIERSIQKVVLGQTLTSSTDGQGSRALGEVHLEVQNNKVNADIRMITPTLQAMVDALCFINSWDRHKIIVGDEKSLNTDKAGRDEKLKNAGANLTPQYFKREYSLQDGDVADTPQALPVKQFRALPNLPFSFATSVKDLTLEQQELDELTEPNMQLFSDAVIKDLIANSTSIEDLRDKLFDLAGGADTSQFNELMDRALFAADILGYVHSKEGR